MKSNVSAALREARAKTGLSLRDITKLSDGEVNGTYIRLIESKGAIPSPKKLRVICKILKLDFLEMMILAGHISKAELGQG